MEIGILLKSLRTEREIGLNQLARWSGVPASYISLLEQGKRKKPSVDILFKLTKAMSMTEEETSLLIVAMNTPGATPEKVQEKLFLSRTTNLTVEQGTDLAHLCLNRIGKCLLSKGSYLNREDLIYIGDVVEGLVSHLANKAILSNNN